MRPDDDARIRHMLDACETIKQFLSGRTRTDMDNDLQLSFGVRHAISIIGEAAYRVSKPTQEKMPNIQWRQISDMRNRLIHGYFDVNPNIVWSAATVDVPDLARKLRSYGY